jgi:hypothetical protein
VYLTGVADHAGTSDLPNLALLPKGARPKHILWFGAFNEASSGNVFVRIDAAGHVSVQGPDAAFFTSLAGISFPLGS